MNHENLPGFGPDEGISSEPARLAIWCAQNRYNWGAGVAANYAELRGITRLYVLACALDDEARRTPRA